jgi:hypothetical protein
MSISVHGTEVMKSTKNILGKLLMEEEGMCGIIPPLPHLSSWYGG